MISDSFIIALRPVIKSSDNNAFSDKSVYLPVKSWQIHQYALKKDSSLRHQGELPPFSFLHDTSFEGETFSNIKMNEKTVLNALSLKEVRQFLKNDYLQAQPNFSPAPWISKVKFKRFDSTPCRRADLFIPTHHGSVISLKGVGTLKEGIKPGEKILNRTWGAVDINWAKRFYPILKSCEPISAMTELKKYSGSSKDSLFNLYSTDTHSFFSNGTYNYYYNNQKANFVIITRTLNSNLRKIHLLDDEIKYIFLQHSGFDSLEDYEIFYTSQLGTHLRTLHLNKASHNDLDSKVDSHTTVYGELLDFECANYFSKQETGSYGVCVDLDAVMSYLADNVSDKSIISFFRSYTHEQNISKLEKIANNYNKHNYSPLIGN